MTEFGSLEVNPTLRMSNGAILAEPPAWKIHYFTPKNAQCSRSISASLAKVLLNLQLHPNPEDYLTSEAIHYLIAQDILVPKTRKPQYKCSVPHFEAATNIAQWKLNPHFTFFADAQKGARLRKHAPWGGITAEYSLNEELTNAAWDLAHGTCNNRSALNSLHKVGYIGTQEAFAQDELHQQNLFLQWQENYKTSKYTLIENLVSQIELKSLQNYCADIQRRGFLDGDFGVAGKQRSHLFDDPQLRWLLERGAQLASKITNAPLISSYSFLAFYHAGGVLPPHRDKSHCNISMSLAINVPDDVSSTWPLEVQDPLGNSRNLYWGTGNTLLFDGRHYQHERSPMPSSDNAVYLILHFQLNPEYL